MIVIGADLIQVGATATSRLMDEGEVNGARQRPVAQLAEQRSPKPQVGGSSPSWPATASIESHTLTSCSRS